MSEQTVSCPYNPTHRFVRSKLMFHLIRCKDKQKLEHLFTKCRYNSLHIFLKNQIETHEFVCPDKAMQVQLMQELKTSESRLNRPFVEKTQRSRSSSSSSSSSSRSRSRGRKQEYSESEAEPQSRNERIEANHSCLPALKGKSLQKSESDEDDFVTLEECEQCQKLIKLYLSTNPPTNSQVMELLDKYKCL